MTKPDLSDETIFAAALERPTPERAAYLDGACAGDPRVPGFVLSHHPPMNTDNPATKPDKKQPREPLSKARFAITSNFWSFLLWGALAANQAYSCDLQKPMDRLLLFVWSLVAVLSAILAIQDRLEQRIVKLLDCLEHKGALSVEDRAAIGIVPPTMIDPGTLRGAIRAVVIGAAIFFALLLAMLFSHRIW